MPYIQKNALYFPYLTKIAASERLKIEFCNKNENIFGTDILLNSFWFRFFDLLLDFFYCIFMKKGRIYFCYKEITGPYEAILTPF